MKYDNYISIVFENYFILFFNINNSNLIFFRINVIYIFIS